MELSEFERAVDDPLDTLPDEDLVALGDAIQDVIASGYATSDGDGYAEPQVFDHLNERINRILEKRSI